ncbi:MAG TPA: hypothetical protein VMH22_06125 [bacterium]|nr:hypothetical protein [bacterium]
MNRGPNHSENRSRDGSRGGSQGVIFDQFQMDNRTNTQSYNELQV